MQCQSKHVGPSQPSSTPSSKKIDKIQLQIDKFDSDDAMTKAGAAGVDEEIMAELKIQGWVSRQQIDPMELNIHHLNRGGVIGNSMNLLRLVDNICDLNFAWAECEHALV